MVDSGSKDIVALFGEANSLNSKIFSLPRLKLLLALDAFGRDGVQFRELRAALNLSDGALISNLNYLAKSNYVKKKEENVDQKAIDVYCITTEGKEMLKKVREWLGKWIAAGEQNGE
ncbi:MAG: transcriptional regulator [Candidatus Micrarchaeota archaeon]